MTDILSPLFLAVGIVLALTQCVKAIFGVRCVHCRYCFSLLLKAPPQICPNCGNYGTAWEDSPLNVRSHHSRCKVCGTPGQGFQLRRLWDGNSYCRDCLLRESPRISRIEQPSDYIRHHQPLWINAIHGIESSLVPIASGLFVTLLVFIAGIWGAVALRDIASTCLWILGGMCVVGILHGATTYLVLPRRTVLVRDGLIVSSPDSLRAISLDECSWTLGTLDDVSPKTPSIFGSLSSRTVAVLIRLPITVEDSSLSNRGIVIALAFRESERLLWCEFLKLAGISSDIDSEELRRRKN